MPEPITKYPDVVIQTLNGSGARISRMRSNGVSVDKSLALPNALPTVALTG